MGNDKSIEDLYKLLSCLNTKIDNAQETLNDIKSEVSGLSAKIVKLEEENITLKNQIKSLDRRLRKNNLVVFGLETKDASLSLQKLSQILEVPLDLSHFNNIYFIPNKNNQVILKLELNSYLIKTKIFGSLNKLKNTKMYITNDLNAKDQLTQKTLRG
ncbi:unnamed protein product [Psylliodes chrysocephalus]|uniref:Uncharacterized protein n=1 Tax=Psylliodes chrysocephalus TaxID=3402493 RepID=A0A9P0CWG6_9CUCU|nr:unnamed protein product [Psylliodes chrysocephala]